MPSHTFGRRPLGIVLGSGSARGWAHIGVIRQLVAMGIELDIVCGTSVGALVGAAYVIDKLDAMESWALGITSRNMVRYLDLSMILGGGFIGGRRLMNFLRSQFGDARIEDLPKRFGAVATDLKTGGEVWLTSGPIWDAVRASIALPGIITPSHLNGQWLVDGGVVNPVPVSLCRSMGAETVIAVDLNADIVGRHFTEKRRVVKEAPQTRTEAKLLHKMRIRLKERIPVSAPGLFDVLAGSLNIMQHQITRDRMEDHTPEVAIAPQLAQIGLLEFDRAREAMAEGKASVRAAADVLRALSETKAP
jgi:NTE family protein